MLDELQGGPGCVLDHNEPTFGPDHSVFPSPLVARATWLAFKDLVMEGFSPCERPWAWWAFEQHEPDMAWASRDAEAARLEALGVLSDLEKGYLEAWRRDAAELAAALQRSVDAYEATKHARPAVLAVPVAAP